MDTIGCHTGSGGLSPLPASLPAAHFDKMTFTVRDNRRDLDDVFKTKLGRGKPVWDKNSKFYTGAYFESRGIFISGVGYYGWRNIQLEGNIDNLNLLSIVTAQTGLRFNLKSLELAFDIKHLPKDDHYTVQNRIAYRLCPIYGRVT